MKLLNEILPIRYPLIQGGMAHIATGLFAAQCSNAGMLGTIGSGAMTPDELRKEIDICRANTERPFAVNLVLSHRHIDEMARKLDALEKELAALRKES